MPGPKIKSGQQEINFGSSIAVNLNQGDAEQNGRNRVPRSDLSAINTRTGSQEFGFVLLDKVNEVQGTSREQTAIEKKQLIEVRNSGGIVIDQNLQLMNTSKSRK